MNVDGCALQCYELLRPVPLQEIPEHVEERRLHRWHQQMPIDQVPTYRLIRELDNTTAPCILYVFYYLYISDVGPTSLTTRRWLRDNLFVDDATRLISIIIFFFLVCLSDFSLTLSLITLNQQDVDDSHDTFLADLDLNRDLHHLRALALLDSLMSDALRSLLI